MQKLSPRRWLRKLPLAIRSHTASVVAVLLIATVGTVLLMISRAAPFTANTEPESGSLSGGAAMVNDSNASGGKAIKFGANSGSAAYVYPLKVSSNKRYLVDQNNKPFFIAADTAWSLLTELSVADANKYIDLRKAQGFNTIQTVVVAYARTESGPHGSPFQGSDMTRPNESYFAAVDQILDHAKSQGMIMYVGTFWKTDNGGAGIDGFPVPAPWPTDNELRSYATYLGGRYADQDNLIWFNGGDGNPDARVPEMKAFGGYMKAAMPNTMISYHTWGKAWAMAGEWWLDFHSLQWNSNSPPYSYQDIRELAGWSPTKPVLDMEPAYDPNACCGSDVDTSELENRHNGWWAVLSGALGVAYGGPRSAWNVGETNNQLDLNAINRNGARHTGNIQKIMSPLKWYLLEPDWNNNYITGGRGSYGWTNYATAERSSDGSLIVAYTPEGAALTVNLSSLSGPATAKWYDPTNANVVSSSNVNNAGSQTFNIPGNNAGGNNDWVLVISTAP
jgi:hypothetical protein